MRFALDFCVEILATITNNCVQPSWPGLSLRTKKAQPLPQLPIAMQQGCPGLILAFETTKSAYKLYLLENFKIKSMIDSRYYNFNKSKIKCTPVSALALRMGLLIVIKEN